MEELAIKLPPWSKQKRILVTGILTSFILIASGCIGVGIYQLFFQSGYAKPQLTKRSILESLLADAEFLRTIKHVTQLRDCVNPVLKFSYRYEAPLHQTRESNPARACVLLVAIHPSGSEIKIELSADNRPRRDVVLSTSKEFTTAATELISGTGRETSVISGVRKGIPTTIYVTSLSPSTSFVVNYQPTSPLIDTKVTELVQSLNFF